MLKNISLFSDYSNQLQKIEQNQAKLKNLQNKILEWNQKAIKIQRKFDFILPNYIIDEIVENEEKKDYCNLNYLVNCAVVNGKISENNGKIIKRIYCYEKSKILKNQELVKN